MRWEQARRLLRLGRSGPRSRRFDLAQTTAFADDAETGDRAISICVASGKGGTGKSVLCSSLATLFALRGKTLLFDADLGVGNAHILQNVSPESTFADVIEGELDVPDIIQSCRPQLDLLAAGSGYAKLASLSARELHVIGDGLERLELDYRYLIVDSAAGISNQTISFAAAADIVLLVTTPDVTALTDVYAFFKVLLQRRPDCVPLLVVNRASSEEEASSAAGRIAAVSQKFLGREPRWVGMLPEDRAAFESIQRRSPVVLSEPAAPLSDALNELTRVVVKEAQTARAHGLGRALVERVGYSPMLV